MSLYKQFATDKTKETDGVWFDYDVDEATGKSAGFKLLRMSVSNKVWAKELERVTKPVRRSIELGTLGEAMAKKLEREAFVNVLLVDWRNITDKDGNDLTFSKANALKLFEELPELYTDLVGNAQKLSNFRDDALDDDVKN